VGLSLGGVLVLVALSFMGVDVRPFLGLATQPQSQAPGADANQPYQETPQETKLRELTAVVLADTEDAWHEILPRQGVEYVEPTLVLFSGAVDSACGQAESAMGPFYCPSEQKVYIDLSFYDELATRFGAPGDFAQAYVIAHEFGHHVQTLLGIEGKVRRAMEQSPSQEKELSVRLELQADCLAGVWGHGTAERNILENGDVEKGLAAAAAVGDDRLQRMQTGHVNPDAFTHGSSAERVAWFKRGYTSGRPEDCDTFSAARGS